MRRFLAGFLAVLLFPYVMTLAWSGSIAGADGVGLGWNLAGRQELLGTGVGPTRTIYLDSQQGEAVDMETYLVGMTARQISAQYELEAVKAQVVLARTYLCGRMGDSLEIRESDLGLSGLSGLRMETLWGKKELAENYEKIKQAVAETEGMVAVQGENLIEPLFHQVSAGCTRDGGEAYPYLKSVDSRKDVEAENYLTVVEWTPEEFVRLLETEAAIEESQALETMQLVSKEEAGYVKEYQIGSHIFTGEALGMLLGLPSSAYSLSVHEGNIRAVCRGIGHGYGLSQYGAHRKAEEGSTAEEILSYYYREISFVPWWEAAVGSRDDGTYG